MKKLFILSILASLFAVGCSSKSGAPKAPDVKAADAVAVNIIRLDRDLAKSNVNNLTAVGPMIRAKYGEFGELYCEGILGIGRTTSPDFQKGLYAFLTYPVVQEGFSASNRVFTPEVISKVEEELSSAFTLYKGTFPDRQIPKVYSYVAGFNQSMMLADGALGIGLDKYLGADYKNYPSMGFPRYIMRKMTVEQLPVDAMYAWASGEFPIKSASEPLLSHMVYQGKMMYLVSQMMPNVTDTLLFGFTKKQMKWVKNNEKMMWEVLIGQKLLFNTEQMVATKMVGEAPFTTIYSPDSPGKAAVWQGFRIVSSYMKNTGSTLDQLMKEDDFQKILDLAKYKP